MTSISAKLQVGAKVSPVSHWIPNIIGSKEVVESCGTITSRCISSSRSIDPLLVICGAQMCQIPVAHSWHCIGQNCLYLHEFIMELAQLRIVNCALVCFETLSRVLTSFNWSRFWGFYYVSTSELYKWGDCQHSGSPVASQFPPNQSYNLFRKVCL